MEERRYESSPSYGFIRKEYTRFNDIKLFSGKNYLFSAVKKIKIWYGTPAKGDNNLKTKVILGIECQYKLLDGGIIKGGMYTSKLESDDIITKELELKDQDDFFTKFYICFDDIISYIKIESQKGKIIEVGDCDNNLLKIASFNDAKFPHVIQIFYGFKDDYGLRALGFKHVPKIYMLILSLIDILRLRHNIKNDIKLKEYWEDQNNYKKLDFAMKAIIKMALLPDSPFSIIFRFCVG